jgi:hypothetical protein
MSSPRSDDLSGRTDLDAAALGAELREAYERGRRDERASRRRRPVFMGLTFLAAVAGVVFFALAAANGSFAGGGGAVDRSLAAALDRAGPAAGRAAEAAHARLADAAR